MSKEERKDDPKRSVPNTALLLRMLLRKKAKKKEENDETSPTVGRGSTAAPESTESLPTTKSAIERKDSRKSHKEKCSSKDKCSHKEKCSTKDRKRERDNLKTMEEFDPGLQSTKFEIVKSGARPAHTKMRKRNIMLEGNSKELEILRDRCRQQEMEIRELKHETTQLKELNEKLGQKPSISQTDSGEMPLTEHTTTAHSGPFATGSTTLPPKPTKGVDSKKKSPKEQKDPKDGKETEEESVRLFSTYLPLTR